MMNAFLFNSWVILLCSLPAVQFCVYAFPIYARFTQADVMFGAQVKYMRFFKYFFNYNVFIIAIMCFAGLTGLYLMLCPKNRADEIEKELNKLAKSSSTSLKDIPVVR
jgi:LMBR1 domain-containing protein 1